MLVLISCRARHSPQRPRKLIDLLLYKSFQTINDKYDSAVEVNSTRGSTRGETKRHFVLSFVCCQADFRPALTASFANTATETRRGGGSSERASRHIFSMESLRHEEHSYIACIVTCLNHPVRGRGIMQNVCIGHLQPMEDKNLLPISKLVRSLTLYDVKSEQISIP